MEAYHSVPVYSLFSVRRFYSIYHLTFGSDYRFEGERHNFWEFNYVLRGKAGCTSGENIYRIEEGDAMLQTPNTFHNMWTDDNEQCEMFIASFDGSGFDNGLKGGKYKLNDEEQHSIQAILRELPPLFRGYNCTEFTPLESVSSPGDVGYQIIKSHLELLCLSLSRRGKAARGTPSSDELALCYARISMFLREHVESALTLDDICHGVYESAGKIKSIFRQFTGGGVMKYYNLLRCEHIMELLSEGMTVQSVATRMNFSSPYYLSYFFKRETGMTPRDYCKREQK